MNNKLIIIALFIIQSATLIAGGGWPQPKGEGYFKLYQWWIISDQHYTDSGLIDPNVTSGIFNTSLYAEYGITNRLTGILNFPFFSRAYNNNIVSQTTQEILAPGSAINSIGDTDIGLKYGIFSNDRLSISGSVILGLPLGKDVGGLQNNLQTGDGEFNQLVQVDVGVPLGGNNISLYANASAGFNNRTEGFSDEFRYGLELGAGLFSEKLWLIGRLTGTQSLNNGSLASEINSTSIFANNSEFTSIGIEASYSIKDNFGVSAGVAGAVSGKIIYAAPSYSVGFFYKLK